MKTQKDYIKELKSYLWENQLSINDYQIERLAHFADLLVKKNQEVNLISRKDEENIIENHIFISALVTEFLPTNANSFLDIGTGGGIPGIPLAITRPMMKGVLVDSTGKKIDAVKEFISKLKLSNAIAENSRVESEEFIKQYQNQFDLIISRGTVPMIILFRYAIPLIKNKAYLLAIKGGDIDAEFKTALLKYKPNIKKSTIFELAYKPTNLRNKKGKKLILLEITK
ncbi:MAG: 16S rRNA (guanine(527)-N(7))-methyltransferase RsmG [Ignavibacteriae bacterium]|nr:16S rRNA (guanine(527)-N(7))-methyltransferase RsmG [Ignavibacteriota bacterium]MCB9249966.1 16S rRNA (guanine(527)-N(7))-methyltransferase RsmG [Ignavibacteriales bacterium]